MKSSADFPDSKSHYQILDGLRGVASVLVIIFHVLETFTGGNKFIQIINHGYLAVDFFFLLSGFVVAYAYDDRWGKLTQWEFYKRRLVRLQPMVVMGSLVGAALFYFQAGSAFPDIAETPVWKMLLIMLIGCTLIPVPLSMDIRGWQEMHPLNGPAWSLFFEYIANILYAVLVRRFSKLLLVRFRIPGGLYDGLLFGFWYPWRPDRRMVAKRGTDVYWFYTCPLSFFRRRFTFTAWKTHPYQKCILVVQFSHHPMPLHTANW